MVAAIAAFLVTQIYILFSVLPIITMVGGMLMIGITKAVRVNNSIFFWGTIILALFMVWHTSFVFPNAIAADIENIVIEKDDDISGKKKYVMELFSQMPVKMQQRFLESRYTIRLCDDVDNESFIASLDPANPKIGYTVPFEKTIYIKNTQFAIETSLYHEIMHCFSVFYGFSKTEEWKNIYLEESFKLTGSVCNNHAKTNATEYLCEAFQQYMGGGNFKRLPKTYAYIDRFVKSWE